MAHLSDTKNLLTAVKKAIEDGQAHVWLEEERLVFGSFPNAIYDFVFSDEELVKIPFNNAVSENANGELTPSKCKKRINLLGQCPRITSISEISTEEAVYIVGSAKQLLLVGLDILEELVPGTLVELARIKKRSKRIVAKDRDDLYDTKHPDTHSEKLKCGYWVATNNRTDEAQDNLAQAAILADLSKESFCFGPAKD